MVTITGMPRLRNLAMLNWDRSSRMPRSGTGFCCFQSSAPPWPHMMTALAPSTRSCTGIPILTSFFGCRVWCTPYTVPSAPSTAYASWCTGGLSSPPPVTQAWMPTIVPSMS